MKHSLTIWFVMLVFLLPLSGYGLYRLYKSTRPLPVLGNLKGEEGRRAGDFKMMNQEAVSIDRNDWEGRIVVVDFFFTSCATICPDMTRSLARVQQSYKNAGDVMICSFSVDPESDSSAALREYASKYGVSAGQWHLLTGNKKEIYRLARNGFRVVATDGDGGPGDFIHSEKLILLDREQQIRGYYDGTSEKEVNKLIKDIKKLRNEK
jgi:protein SCO1/2